MSVVVVGLNHRTAPIELVERIAIGSDDVSHVLDALLKSDHIAEAALISTCLRTEIYIDAVRFHGAVADVRNIVSRVSGVDPMELAGGMFQLFDEHAYGHLFRVACGIESAVVGESEVLGQVARALETARRAGASRGVLTPLLAHAVKVGKRARHETAIARGITSIGQAAVVMASEALGGLGNRRVLLVGAGDMGSRMALTVARTDPSVELHICNRTESSARKLAEQIGARVRQFDELGAGLAEFDLVLTSTGATEPIISTADLVDAMATRQGVPMAVVDMGMPSDVEESASAIPGVTVLDIGSLRDFTATGEADRAGEVSTVDAIIADEVADYIRRTEERAVVPLVRELREWAEAVRNSELGRHAAKLNTLSAEQAVAVDQLTKSILAKLLHDPTVRLKRSAGTGEGDRMAAALRDLLGM